MALRLLRSDRSRRRVAARPTLPTRPRTRRRPSAWDVRRRLADGATVRIRSITPADADAIREGMTRLSERSRYLRFHAPVSALSEAHVKHLVEVDHRSHEALVAESCGDLAPRALGIARFVDEGDGVPEFAIVVVDEAQGRGVGRALLRELFAAARAAGYRSLRAEVLAENTAMMRLLAREARGLDVSRDGTILHVRVDLSTTAARAA